jgi:hypothetical protein
MTGFHPHLDYARPVIAVQDRPARAPVAVPRKVLPYIKTGKEMRERLNRREE